MSQKTIPFTGLEKRGKCNMGCFTEKKGGIRMGMSVVTNWLAAIPIKLLGIKKVDSIKVRLANKEDAVFIALLGRITFTETFGHFFRDKQDLLDYYNATFSVEKIENGIAKPNNLFWIAFANRLPVGYAKLKLNSKSDFIDSTNSCQLQKIYVLKDFLSMKIGLELQDVLLKKAQELEFEEIWLSVLNSNERAISFYKKNGFEKIGNHDFQIGKENFEFIAMSKEL